MTDTSPRCAMQYVVLVLASDAFALESGISTIFLKSSLTWPPFWLNACGIGDGLNQRSFTRLLLVSVELDAVQGAARPCSLRPQCQREVVLVRVFLLTVICG